MAEPGQVLAFASPLNGLHVAVRVPPDDPTTGLQALRHIRERGGSSALLVTGIPLTPLPREVVESSSQIYLDVAGTTALRPDDLAFQLKTRFTELRAGSPDIQLGVVASAAQQAALFERDLAPYVDLIAEPVSPGAGADGWLKKGRSYAIARRSDAERDTSPAPARPVLWLWHVPVDIADAAALGQDLAHGMRLLVADLVPGGSVEVSCGGRQAATFLNPVTLDTVALATDCRDGRIEIKPDGRAVERVMLSTGDVLVRVPAAEDQFAADVQVTGARALSVEEIIARHQAVVARQRARVRTLISTGTLTLAFEAPGFSAPVAITSDTVIYAGEPHTDIEQRSIRVNGIEFAGGGVPRLPIIEPERVASPPLAITLSDLYRYTLAGQDRIGETLCYVVAFAPIDERQSLFRGRAWIAADSFAMVRVAAVQTGLRGAIISSEQIDEFTRHGEGLWLLARSEIRQIYEGAGHRTPIHRVLSMTSHHVNPPDFESRRAAAYQSRSIMLRDTEEGFRYLRREQGKDPSRPVETVVAGPSHRVRTLALGVLIDPNISKPLPFAGLSYVDFNLFGTGTQVNAFFGGTYGQLAFSVPSLGGTRWQLAGRAFGIASSYNDRAFQAGIEKYEHNVTQRPAHTSVWLLRPLTPRVSVRGGYELDYTQYGASDSTAGAFVVPADQVAHSVRLGLEGQRRGWSAAVWWGGSYRAGWRQWGTTAGEFRPGHEDNQRYGATLARPIVITPALVARLEAAWMGGHDLDRFSRYTFGTFDNRLRGYPSALIRYDRGAVFRAAGGWAVTTRLRVDGFLDTAYVHDPGFGAGLRNFTGLGAAIEAPAPFGMLAAAEWGYGVHGVNASGRRGTHVVRISAFKIF